MQKISILGNIPETALAKTNPVYRYYIPAIDEHIWVCRDCRLKYWESILRKKWRLVDRKSEGMHHCMACSEEENQSSAAGETQAEMPMVLQEDLPHLSEKAL